MSAISLGNSGLNLSEQGEPERLQATRVSANFFGTLCVEPALGRAFVPEEDQQGQNRVVVLSDSLWQRRFGGDRDLIGNDIVLSGQSYKVIGVMPASFRFDNDDLWRPLALSSENFAPDQRGNEFLKVIGRLKPETRLEQAQAEMDTIAATIRQNNPGFYPEESGWGLRVTSLRDEVVGSIQPALLVLLERSGVLLMRKRRQPVARAAARQRKSQYARPWPAEGT
jgi:putative ABC transport system permease protein